MDVLPPAETRGQSAVYRVFGDGQQLLYIGSSERPRQRWHEHRNRTPWWSQARCYSLTWLPDRDAAYEAEQVAIVAEIPMFNQVWQPRAIPVPRPPADPVEEVRRVTDALDAVEAITDPEVRARAISEVLVHQTERGTEWRKMRRQVVLDLRAQTPPVSYRRIAKMLGIGLATVQDIETGYTGSGRNRPRAKQKTEEE